MRRFLMLLMIGLLATALAACGDDDDDDNGGSEGDAPTIAAGEPATEEPPDNAGPPAADVVDVFMALPDPTECNEVIPVGTQIPRTGSQATDIMAAVQRLFTFEPAADAGYVNLMYFPDVLVTNTLIEDNRATIDLSGEITLLGACADGQMRAQLTRTIFQFEGIDEALVNLNGQSIRMLFDMSGQAGPDAVFTRP